MAIIKCKMCGGDLNIIEGASTAECEFCGSVQTVPKVDDEKKLTLFARANRLRAACEFDKAAGIYEAIVADFQEEAEAYWGLVLCKYGIEYVDDPGTGKKIPTCHRSSFDSVMDDGDLEQALENADPVARKIYRDEAKAIEELRTGIIAVSSNEAPYDIFICYKETAENGDRTLDSVLAQDVYDALTDKGYRVFFSRISLEDKLGMEYEPYIFAALNSAKIMLAFGTDYEYFNAVWVKNEWSRYLQLMAKDKDKHLIPCYKDINAYDMPKEFTKLQAQDLGKVGATQDLLRGIEKILPKNNKVTAAIKSGGAAETPLLKRAFMYLEDGATDKAEEYFEKSLDSNPECAEAYLGKLLLDLGMNNVDQLCTAEVSFVNNTNYIKAQRFADNSLSQKLNGYVSKIDSKNAEKSGRIATAVEQIKSYLAQNDQRSKARELELKLAKELDVAKTIETQLSEIDQASEKEKIKAQKELVACTEAEIAELNNKQTKLEQQLSKLGIFAGKEKKAIKENIENVRNQIEMLKSKIQLAKKQIEEAESLLKTIPVLTNKLKSQQTVIDDAKLALSTFSSGQSASETISDQQFEEAKSFLMENAVSELIALNLYSRFENHSIFALPSNAFGIKKNGVIYAAGTNDHRLHNAESWRNIIKIAGTTRYVAGLKEDGTVIADGENRFGQCNVSDWTDVVDINCSANHMLGLRNDGTVLASNYELPLAYNHGACDVQSWRGILAIDGDSRYSAGLKKDGTVITTKLKGPLAHTDSGKVPDTGKMYNIVKIVACRDYLIGLRSDGAVMATEYCGENENSDMPEQCAYMNQWTNVKKIVASTNGAAALKEDGTVVASATSMRDAERWNNIIDIQIGPHHVVGLKADGTVVATGTNSAAYQNVSQWNNIVEIQTAPDYTLGLKADGTVVTTSGNETIQRDITQWLGIKVPQ